MITDTSALIAILFDEPDAAGARRISAATFVETAIVVEAQTVALSDYTSRCERCNRKDVAMGHHDFRALSVVQGGGPQSFCSVHRDPNGWILTAVNPANDTGGAQVCSAVCMDFGSRARPTPPPPPESPESLVGSWEWPGGSTMVVSPGGTVPGRAPVPSVSRLHPQGLR